MSFSGEVKEELEKVVGASRHCQLAELAAIVLFCGKLVALEDTLALRIHTENVSVIRKCFTILRKTFNIDSSVQKEEEMFVQVHNRYEVTISEGQEFEKILQALKIISTKGDFALDWEMVSPLLVKSTCCKRAFLRGAYLCAGSMSNPTKSYHCEFVCTYEETAKQLIELLRDFELEGKIVVRKKYYVVYMKEGAAIVELLNVMGAHMALMNLENTRILKEVRNSINRRVNCETANIAKTVTAASKQIEDILYIKNHMGFSKLPDNLRQMAEVRLEYPDSPLKELGEYLEPPVGKSGVNHRLRKLSDIAEKLKS